MQDPAWGIRADIVDNQCRNKYREKKQTGSPTNKGTIAMAIKNDTCNCCANSGVPVTNADYMLRQEATESNARSYPGNFLTHW